jgi:hypothetical protein
MDGLRSTARKGKTGSGGWTWVSLLLLLGLAAARPAIAANEEWLVNDDTEGQEGRRDPLAAPLEDGGYLVAWTDNGRGNTDILARIFDADHQPTGDAFRVNTEEGYFRQSELDLSRPGGGVFAAVWLDERVEDRTVFAQVFSAADASRIGTDFRVDVDLGSSVASSPRVFTGPSGTSLVAWTNQISQHPRVILQFIDAQGRRQGENFLPNLEDTRDDQATPVAAEIPGGRWVLVWSESDPGPDWNIYYRILESDGTPLGPPRRANDDAGTTRQTEPAVLVRSQDILVVWNDNREDNSDLWGVWLDHDGNPEGGNFLLREAADAGSDSRPRLVPGLGDEFAVTWFGGLNDVQRAFVKYFRADRSERSLSRPMDDPAFGVLMRDGAAVPLSDHRWLELWSDNRTPSFQVYLREVDPDSGPVTGILEPYSSPASSSQIYPDVALFPDGRAIVVWGDLRYGSLAIMGRLLDDQGRPIGQSFQINAIPPGAQFDTIDGLDQVIQYLPSVAAGPDRFVVTWAINQEGGRLNLYYQLFEVNGTDVVRVGDNRLVAGRENMLTPQYNARPAVLRDGSFLITYVLSPGAGGRILLQRYTASGADTLGAIRVYDPGVESAQQRPEISLSPFDEAMIVWMDDRQGGWDIYGQRFDALGNRIGANELLNLSDFPYEDQTNPEVGVGEDRTIAVWDYRPLYTGKVKGRLEVFPSLQRPEAGASRALDVTLFEVNASTATPGAKNPDVAVSPDGQFIVTWWENGDGQTRPLAQRFDPTGAPIGDPYEIHGTGTQGCRLGPRVAATRDFIQYVWTDSRRAKGWDIYARRVDWDFSGAPSPVLLSGWNAESTPLGVQLTWATSLEAGFSHFRIWRQESGDEIGDHREPSPNAVLLTPDGLPPSESAEYTYLDRTAPANEPLAYILEAVDLSGAHEYFGPFEARWATLAEPRLAAWPNPFRDELRLRLSRPGDFRLAVLDVTGRQIRTLQGFFDGTNDLVWDGRDARGRPVPAGLYFLRLAGEAEPLKLLRIR